MNQLIKMCTPERSQILRNMLVSTCRYDLTVVEIGSYSGESAAAFLSSGAVKLLYCVDPWTTGYDPATQDSVAEAERVFDARFSEEGRVVKVKGTVDDFISRFPDVNADCVYIDACHDYKAAVRDMFAAYYAIRPRLFIGGHDYDPGHPGVQEAVKTVFGAPDITYRDNSWLVRCQHRSGNTGKHELN